MLLTGASGGLGHAVAAAVGATGAELVVSGLPEPGLDALCAALRADGVTSRLAPADLADPEGAERLAAAAPETDVLIHCAGVEHIGDYTSETAAAREAAVRVNLLSAMALTAALLPAMLSRGCGHFIYVASLAGKTGVPYGASYAAAKGGLVAFGRSIRAEYRARGVSASVIVPGFVSGSGMFARAVAAGETRPAWALGTVSPEAVARAVVRALETDARELLVNRGPVRGVLGAAEALPWLGDRLTRWIGADRLFGAWAASRREVE